MGEAAEEAHRAAIVLGLRAAALVRLHLALGDGREVLDPRHPHLGSRFGLRRDERLLGMCTAWSCSKAARSSISTSKSSS